MIPKGILLFKLRKPIIISLLFDRLKSNAEFTGGAHVCASSHSAFYPASSLITDSMHPYGVISSYKSDVITTGELIGASEHPIGCREMGSRIIRTDIA